MRQVKSLALMITLIVLLGSGCAGSTEDTALLMRTKYLECTNVQAQISIRADYGQSVYDFAVEYTGNSQTGTVTVIQPESIAGVTAAVTDSGCSLEFDGVEFTTGEIAGGIRPAGAPGMLLNQWAEGYITSSCRQKLSGTDTLCVTTKQSDSISQTTWFDSETLTPLESEIYSGGQMIIKCVFTNVEIS